MRFLTALFAFALFAALGCGRSEPSTATAPAGTTAAPRRSAIRPASISWVRVYDPARAFDGFTLTLHDLRTPVLLDMNGRVVHAWPEARIKSRVRLLADGGILGLGLGRSVVEYDWSGRKTWEFQTAGAIPHHDIVRLANGNTLVLVFRQGRKGSRDDTGGEPGDALLEVDRQGRVVWSWNSSALGNLLPAKPSHKHDVTHVNSVQELPDNPWFRAGDRRFTPGNLLLSARNLNLLVILERASGRPVWSFRGTLDRQHEALMAGLDAPSPGAIQVLDNRPGSYFGDHQSQVLELDPRDGRVLWSFRRPGFFTPTGGTQQLLPNGNLLLTSTRGGRVFEITRQGDLVWEWVPPYEPVRALRVSRDACPQLAALAALGRGPVKPVVAARGYRYVDSDAYRFARRRSRRRVAIGGVERTVLAESPSCADLLLPMGATARVGYGIDRESWRASGAPAPVFTVTVQPLEGAARTETVLLRDAVGGAGDAWREATVTLDAFALCTVRLCVAIANAAPAAAPRERFAYFEQPDVATVNDRARLADAANALDGLSLEEREARLAHLRALGYVN